MALKFEFHPRWREILPSLVGDDADLLEAGRTLEKRDRDEEDFLSTLGGGAVGTGSIVLQTDPQNTASVLTPSTQDHIDWTFDLSAMGLDPAFTYRAVFDWVTSAEVHGGSAHDPHPVAFASYVEVTGLGTLSPEWKWYANDIQYESYLIPHMEFASRTSTVVAHDATVAGFLWSRNQGGTSGLPPGVSFWDISYSTTLIITVYQIP